MDRSPWCGRLGLHPRPLCGIATILTVLLDIDAAVLPLRAGAVNPADVVVNLHERLDLESASFAYCSSTDSPLRS